MSDTPYIPFYTSDFLAGTSGMTMATKGAYITLLCLMYETEAPLTQQWDTLARRCGCTLSAFKKAVQMLEDDGKVTVTDAGLWSEKCEKHIEQRRERSESASAAAKKRWEKTQGKQGKPDANASPAQCQPEPEPYKERDTSVSPKKKRASRLPDDWQLPKQYGEWALSQGYAEIVVRLEAEKFKDYWISASGRNAAKLDWLATWRNWMRNSSKTAPTPNGRTKGHDAFNAQIAAGARWDRERAMDRGTDRNSVIPLLPAGRAGGGQRGSND